MREGGNSETVADAKETKNAEIDEVVLTEEEKAGKTAESITAAEAKLEELKNAAKEAVEAAESVEAVNAITVDKTEALALLADEDPVADAKEAKNAEIDEVVLTEEEKAGKTAESITAAEAKLEELKNAAKEAVEAAESVEAVNAITVDKTEALALLADEDTAEQALIDAAAQAKNYTYDDGYSYNYGSLDVSGNEATLTYDLSKVTTNPEILMNDLARYLGALYRVDDGATVASIDYSGANYVWNGELKGSNWKTGNAFTLVSVITAQFLDEEESFDTITITLNDTDNNSVDLTLKFIVDSE